MATDARLIGELPTSRPLFEMTRTLRHSGV
jgi:hypothetical protein